MDGLPTLLAIRHSPLASSGSLDPKPAAAVERHAAGCDRCRPARGRGETAEGEEVRRDVAEHTARRRERADDRIGRIGAEEMLCQPGIAGKRAGGRRDSADRCESQQRRDRRRPGKADAYGLLDAGVAQARDEGEDRRGRERELRDDVNAELGRGRGLDLGRERTVDLGRGDAWMTLRITRDAYLADTAVLRQP